MNSHSHDGFDLKTGLNPESGSGEAETTLRLIAGLPAPQGLEDRLKASFRHTPRSSRLLHWPAGPHSRWIESSWVRTAAAAAIVFVVAGGGWEVYSRVQPAQPSSAIALPPVATHRGFSSANAMRTPRTLNGTVLTHPLPDTAAEKRPTDGAKKPLKKTAAKPVAP
jgi:hypothetical protein